MLTSKIKEIHSHIKGLGVNELGEPLDTENTYIGQEGAREAASIIVEMVRSRKTTGKGLLISGPSGSGKTALAVAISEELGVKIPFYHLSGSEVYSSEIKITEVLQESIRKSILIRMQEYKDIYEGEIVNIDIKEQQSPVRESLSVVEEIHITLRSTKASKIFKVSPSLYDQINQQGITVGDVVYIESSAGIIKKMGRSDSHMNDFDLEAERYVPLPKGEIYNRKEMVQETTLHELDTANCKPTGQDVLSLISQIICPRKTEITERLRNEVNHIVYDYIDVGKAEIITGILFIDDDNMMDMECFRYLNKVLESPLCPMIIIASNVSQDIIKGGDDTIFPFGLPQDFLDRLVIIKLQKPTIENQIKIVELRIKEESLEFDKDAIDSFHSILKSKGLRYCVALLPIFKTYSSVISKKDVIEVSELFKALY